MELKEFRKKIKEFQRPVEGEEIEWKVQGYTKDKSKTIMAGYVTARVVMGRLDECFGPAGWRNELEVIEGHAEKQIVKGWKDKEEEKVLYTQRGFKSGISIKIDGEWVTKWDVSDNTDIEPLKGGASSAMKRAAVQWGLGRELYELPKIFLTGQVRFPDKKQIKFCSDVLKIEASKRNNVYTYTGKDLFADDFKPNPKDEIIAIINKKLTKEEVSNMRNHYNVGSLQELDMSDLTMVHDFAMKQGKLINTKMITYLEKMMKELEINLFEIITKKFKKKTLDQLVVREYRELKSEFEDFVN